MTKRRGNKEGTIYQRPNGKWRAQIAQNGDRLSHTADTRKEVQDWLREISNQFENGLTLKSARTTFGKYLEEWLASSQSRLTEHSWRYYGQLIRDYIGPALGNIRLRDLTPSHIQRFYNQKVAEGLGLRTVQKTHTVMHAALNSAMKLGLIGRNPASATQPPKPTPKPIRFLTEDQVRQLLDYARQTEDRHFALYYLAIVTGMREGELLALRWQDVDLEKGIVQVRFNLKRSSGGGLVLKRPKTKSSIRSIQLGTDSIEVLRQQEQCIAQWKEALDGQWRETGHVFPSSVGTPMDPTNMLRFFRKLLKNSGLPKIRFHDLRHTAASLMLNNGVDVLIASQRLGHAKPSITLDVYGHLMPSMQAGAAEVLERLITG